MTVLKLKVGDRVRNINKMSRRRGHQGVVHDVSYHSDPMASAREYHVIYDNGTEHTYNAQTAHIYLELIAGSQNPTKLDYGTNYRDASMMARSGHSTLPRGMFNISGLQCPGKRKVLRRERVNVITGKTQSEMMRELGPARGATEFNTRALGRSTGQALHAIGSAMTNPGTEIRISGIDHFLESDEHMQQRGRVNRHQVDQHFRALVQSLVGNMKGFSFTATHITFNPIVTEEVYVE